MKKFINSVDDFVPHGVAGLVMAHEGLPQVGFAHANADVTPTLGWPCWVKPARLGSSVGIVQNFAFSSPSRKRFTCARVRATDLSVLRTPG